jgi:peptidyl-tRNA hydrolase, PTH1 family
MSAVAERPWVETLCDIIADNAAMLVRGEDSGFQNKVHLAMQAKGFDDVTQVGQPKKE